MSDARVVPDVGHNLPPVAEIGKEITHHAHLWTTNVGKGDEHKREIMVRAYRLRFFMEDPDTRLSVEGLLSDAKIPNTERSRPFTRLLNYAFRKADWQAEKSRVSRWAWALQHVWNQEPRPAVEEVLQFIKDNGGDEKCAARAKEPRTSSSGTVETFELGSAIPEGLFSDGKTRIAGALKLADNKLQFVCRKRRSAEVLSTETTPAPEQPTANMGA